jgi:hypothetical protein
MFYKKWVDFVIYPLDSNKVLTREQRLDVSTAVLVTDANYTPELGTEKGVVFPKEQIFFDDDEFETMWMGETGGVIIWTKKRVWCLYKLEAMERMQFVPRHPDSDELWLSAHKLNKLEKF